MPKRKQTSVENAGERPTSMKIAKSGLVNLEHIPQAVQARYDEHGLRRPFTSRIAKITSFQRNESMCLLWRLPGNVRNLIYEYAMGHRYARIYWQTTSAGLGGGRLGHYLYRAYHVT